MLSAVSILFLQARSSIYSNSSILSTIQRVRRRRRGRRGGGREPSGPIGSCPFHLMSLVSIEDVIDALPVQS